MAQGQAPSSRQASHPTVIAKATYSNRPGSHVTKRGDRPSVGWNLACEPLVFATEDYFHGK